MVLSVAGVIGLCVVPFFIWRFLRAQPPDDRVENLFDRNNLPNYGAANGSYNPITSGSETTSRSASPSLTNPSSTNSSSRSDIIASSKESYKEGNRPYVC